ncbi:hypothetical protein TNCV_3686801 [Trichonephila clavipes]|nr:hypothetical protein TNCV_3686801 [Trichonephila clavipes]
MPPIGDVRSKPKFIAAKGYKYACRYRSFEYHSVLEQASQINNHKPYHYSSTTKESKNKSSFFSGHRRRNWMTEHPEPTPFPSL